MKTKLKMVYWKGEGFLAGNLLEHPEIMTQGETLGRARRKYERKCTHS